MEKNLPKRNLSLIIGISIPLFMILFVAGTIYLPPLFSPRPKFNFLYSSGYSYDRYNYCQDYSVENGKLIIEEKREKIFPPFRDEDEKCKKLGSEIKLFVHDIAKNKSKMISFEEAQNLNLDITPESPDGFEIICGREEGGVFPFFSLYDSNCDQRYLKGHNVSKKLNLQLYKRDYYDNFLFLGWIKNKPSPQGAGALPEK